MQKEARRKEVIFLARREGAWLGGGEVLQKVGRSLFAHDNTHLLFRPQRSIPRTDNQQLFCEMADTSMHRNDSRSTILGRHGYKIIFA
ncbi:hypothetical protein TNCV_4863471 [Trichonephila clavipes]|nr:hypothetical protein TNCV_4863471 [Trichonephila clavipes]